MLMNYVVNYEYPVGKAGKQVKAPFNEIFNDRHWNCGRNVDSGLMPTVS